MPEPASHPTDVVREVRRLADALYPGLGLPAELRVRLPDGTDTVIRAPGGVSLTDRQRDIVQALEEAGQGARLSGPAIAKLAGYECDAHFREDLAALVRLGRLVSHRPGYSLPE